MNGLGKCSIINEISKAEEAIKTCYKRIDLLDAKLQTKDLHPDQRITCERELMEVRKLLETNEKLLSTLHKHNRGSFLIAASLCFVCFTIYMFYILIVGVDNKI